MLPQYFHEIFLHNNQISNLSQKFFKSRLLDISPVKRFTQEKQFFITLRYEDIFVLCLHATPIYATIQNNVFNEHFNESKSQC